MALEGTLLQESPIVEFTALAALASGQVVQVPDGRAGVCPAAYALGQPACAQVAGTFALAKTASIVLLAGQKVYWTKSTGKATYDSDSDFYVGVCAKDAAAAATTVEVHLNQESCAPIQLGKTEFIAENTLGLTPARVVGLSKAIDLAFDAVAEVAETAIYSKRTIPLATGMRAFFEMSLEDEGNDAALDWVVGLTLTRLRRLLSSRATETHWICRPNPMTGQTKRRPRIRPSTSLPARRFTLPSICLPWRPEPSTSTVCRSWLRPRSVWTMAPDLYCSSPTWRRPATTRRPNCVSMTPTS